MVSAAPGRERGVDGACSLQLKTSFLDIVGRMLGKLRPWRFQAPAGEGAPFRSLEGVFGGIARWKAANRSVSHLFAPS